MKKNLGLICYLSVFLIVEFLFGYFILETRSIFLEKTVQSGEYLSQSYVEKISTRLEEYIFAVELAGQYLQEMEESGVPAGEQQQWLSNYCEKVTEKFGDNVLDFYAVINGSIVATHPWPGDGDYAYHAKSWYYQSAVDPGTVVFSDLYEDAVTRQNVFTISLALDDPKNVIALDVYLASENWMGFTDLPEGYGLFVYDSQATLAYSLGRSYLIEFPMEEYIALQQSEKNTIHCEKAVSANYNLFLCALENGWSVIVAIPSQNLVSDEHMFLMDVGLRLNILNVAIVIVFLIRNELTKRKRNQDTLTGLMNKSYFMKCVRDKLKRGDGVLLMIDLDNFKALNDNYGHDCGDQVLQQVAVLLEASFRKTDCIGRFGGDEFIVFLDMSLPQSILEHKSLELIRQTDTLAQAYPRSGLSMSIGGCRCKKGDKYTAVFKWADQALYSVKSHGKGSYAMYSETTQKA